MINSYNRATGKINATNKKSKIAIGCLVILAKLLKIIRWRGMGKVGSFVVKIFRIDPVLTIELSSDSKMNINLHDPYWNRLVDSRFTYETEISFALDLFKDLKYLFVDGGANIGYWSILNSSNKYGKQHCVAIEASKKVFEILEQNRQLNNACFDVKHKAISNSSNQEVVFHNNMSHASGSLISLVADDEDRTEKVLTITIDEVLEQYSYDSCIIKLDVEGVEISAIEGATNTIRNTMPLFIYEEHGNDKANKVSHYLSKLENYYLYYIDNNHNIRLINDVDSDLENIKTNSKKGYNLFAAHSETMFSSLLEELIKKQ